MKLFAQNRYAHTCTRAIAREAGMSAGLLYHYFDSKESLQRAVFDNCFTAELRRAGWDEPELEAHLLYSLVEGTIQQYLLDPGSYPLERVAARIVAPYIR